MRPHNRKARSEYVLCIYASSADRIGGHQAGIGSQSSDAIGGKSWQYLGVENGHSGRGFIYCPYWVTGEESGCCWDSEVYLSRTVSLGFIRILAFYKSSCLVAPSEKTG